MVLFFGGFNPVTVLVERLLKPLPLLLGMGDGIGTSESGNGLCLN